MGRLLIRLLFVLVAAAAGFAVWVNRAAIVEMGRDYLVREKNRESGPDPETYTICLLYTSDAADE